MGLIQDHPETHWTKAVLRRPSQGAAAPPLALIGPSFGQLHLTAMPNVGVVVTSRFNVHGGQFGAFQVGIKHIPWTFPPHL
jgi:hypothetical protein